MVVVWIIRMTTQRTITVDVNANVDARASDAIFSHAHVDADDQVDDGKHPLHAL